MISLMLSDMSPANSYWIIDTSGHAFEQLNFTREYHTLTYCYSKLALSTGHTESLPLTDCVEIGEGTVI